jgi:hypothetical protein
VGKLCRYCSDIVKEEPDSIFGLTTPDSVLCHLAIKPLPEFPLQIVYLLVVEDKILRLLPSWEVCQGHIQPLLMNYASDAVFSHIHSS